ncbi:MAG: transcriptional regulator [Wenzhouxiangellaceae bacterium]|nr:transcriptional regulator [Wenzhouxiangellaceae bacterium]
MNEHPGHHRKLLTVVTEAALESVLTRELPKWGAKGYTITNARGRGHRGVRRAGWDADSNIRIEVVCDEPTARRIADELQRRYYDNYAMILVLSDVEVLRPAKFDSAGPTASGEPGKPGQ